MRRFLSTSFLALALLIGATGAAPVAHAQWTADPGINSVTGTNAPTPGTTAAAAKIPADMKENPSLDGTMAQIMSFIMSLFAWLLGVAMLTLNNSVYYTVVTMGDYVHKLSAVGVAWRILRDIGNIMLIFGFLAVGITTILNADWYGGGKKMLPMMLVAAVFLNFSLFISEAIIDTGNLFATQFYTQINGGTFNEASTKISFSNISNEGISTKIMTQLGLAQIYGQALTNKEVLPSGTSVFIAFMSIILFMVAAFVMFSLAFVLISRFVYLIFLIILAPVGFAGLAVPQLAKRAGQWWSKLFEQTIIAPVLLLMLYIALAIITDANFLGFGPTAGDWAGFVTKSGSTNFAGFAGILLSFLVAMGLLILVVVQAKNLGAVGAASMMKFGQKAASGAANFAGRSALGVGKYTTRQIAGRGAHMASQGLMRTDFGQTQFGRLVATGLGKGGKGFKEAKDKSIKAHEEYVKSVGAAIEEHHAPVIANARLNRENADETSKNSIKAVTTERDSALKDAKPLIDEVKRLEEIIKSKGKFDPERMAAEKNLPAAKTKADSASAKIKTAEDKLKTVSAPLKAAQNEEEKATKDLAKAKREAAVAYGKSARTAFTENPFAWAVTGSGGSAAGNKIIKDTLKSMTDVEKSMKVLKDAWEKDAKTANKSAEISEEMNKAKENRTEQIKEEVKQADKS